MGADALALQKIFQNIVRLFMDGKLEYKPIRTMTLGRDHAPDGARLRTARRESQKLPPVRRLPASLEEAKVT